MVGAVGVEALRDETPEPVLGQHAVAGEDRGEVAQDAVEHVGEDRERLLLVVDDGAHPLDAGRERRVAEDGDLLADVLHDRADHDVVAQDEDEVLAVRHEREVVREERVGERAQVGVEVGAHPVGGVEPGGAHERGRVRGAVGVAVQERGHGGEALPGRGARHGALAPQGGEHLAVRGRRGGAVVDVTGVPDRGELAQHGEPAAAELRVGGDEVRDPVVDRGVSRMYAGDSPRRNPMFWIASATLT